jgi:hypothetical protein
MKLHFNVQRQNGVPACAGTTGLKLIRNPELMRPAVTELRGDLGEARFDGEECVQHVRVEMAANPAGKWRARPSFPRRRESHF